MIFVVKMCTLVKAALRGIRQAIGIAEVQHLHGIVFVKIGEDDGQGRSCRAFLALGSNCLRVQGRLGADEVVLPVKKAAHSISAADVVGKKFVVNRRRKGARHCCHGENLAKN